MTIVNFMPVYAQAPVSLHLLKNDLEAGCRAVAGALSAGDAVLLPAGEAEAADALRAALPEGTRVIECDPELGFVYTNASAAARVLVGEKPIPSHANGEGAEGSAGEPVLLSGASLLLPEGRRAVWVEGAAAPVELGATATVGELVAASGVEAAKAVYVGYPAGALLSAADADAEVELSSDYVRVYGEKDCMAEALRAICAQARRETCGRCVFGHEGGHQISTIMEDVCRKKGKPGDVALLRDLCPVMEQQSLCEQGRVLARTVLAFLDLFEGEISAHIGRKTCPAGECKAYLTYHVLASKCQACNACVDVCEEDAILGRPRFIHVIDQKACTQCGACLAACEHGAIVTAGAVKPKCPPKPIPFRKR